MFIKKLENSCSNHTMKLDGDYTYLFSFDHPTILFFSQFVFLEVKKLKRGSKKDRNFQFLSHSKKIGHLVLNSISKYSIK